MMKKVFAAILSIALIAGVSACGEKKAEGPDYADDDVHYRGGFWQTFRSYR